MRKLLGHSLTLTCGLALLAVLAPLAAATAAERAITTAGEGNGQTSSPSGLAVDAETKQLYVADSGNHRIDVFDASGQFEMAWGWGVADGGARLETCGPKAPSLQPTCRRGLAGGGAGEFSNLGDIAVDNSGDPSRHDVYVLDSTGKSGSEAFGYRVQKFTPAGEFLLTFGAGVITGGAEGSGDLSLGSTTVTDAVATQGAFAVGQAIAGPGIPAGTTVTGIGATSLTLSRPAEASATTAPLSVAAGAGHVAVNEVQEVGGEVGVNLTKPSPFARYYNLGVTTPDPSGSDAGTGALGEGRLHANSTQVTGVKISAGEVLVGENVNLEEGEEIPEGTTVAAYDPAAEELTLSQPAAAKVSRSPLNLKMSLPADAPATLVQEALESLPNLGAGSVSVAGPSGGPFEVEFQGRFSDVDMPAINEANGQPTRVGTFVGVRTIQNGAGDAAVCGAAIAASCADGTEGFGAGQFARNAALAVAPSGEVYVADSVELFRQRGQQARFEGRLQKFTNSGAPLEQLSLFPSGEAVAGLAVGAGGGFYLATQGSIAKYEADGSPLGPLAQPGLNAPLAIGPAGALFARSTEFVPRVGYSVAELNSSGMTETRFGYGAVSVDAGGFAAYEDGAGGRLYASQGDHVVYLGPEPPGPFVLPTACEATSVGNSRATLNAAVNPEGLATHFYYEYVDQADFAQSGFANAERAPAKAAEDPALGSAEPSLQPASLRVEVRPETKYHCRVVAYNADNEGGATGPAGEFTTKKPFEILASSALAVGTETAQLEATVNPLGIPTGGYFEYVDDATYREGVERAEADPTDVSAAEAICEEARERDEERGEAPPDEAECVAAKLREHGFDRAGRAPTAPSELDFGAGESPHSASAEVTGLTPSTLYHYRIVVDDHLIPPAGGPGHTFRTRNPGSEPVPDGRAYELVSPTQKNSADVGAPINAANASAVAEASADGEAMTFASFIAFGEAKGAPSRSQYLARRSGAGWSTENLDLFGFLGLTSAGSTPYEGFTPDLGFGAATSYEPPLTEDALKGYETLYWRDNATGALRAINTEEPTMAAGSGSLCVAYGGASADGQDVIFAANGSLAGAPVGVGMSLYQWSPRGGVSLVSVLPNRRAATPAPDTAFGAASRFSVECRVSALNFHNAISADGKTIFWTDAGSPSMLLARVDGRETVQLDASQGGPGPEGGGKFLAASNNGSSVLFSDPNQLTGDSNGGGDLYRYDFEAPAGEHLTDLTPAAASGAHVLGLLGSSEDGQYAYFAAESAIGPDAPVGCASAPCLYLWHDGEGVRFIAVLSGKDAADWNPEPAAHGARASTDGRDLAFTTIAPLGDYDNRIQGAAGCALANNGTLEGDEHCAEVYLYDAEGGTLSCASCNPTGQRPVGPASLPPWTNSFEGPRYLSADGSRLFFQTPERLVPGDEDEVQDVYEFERPGAGSCTAASPAFGAEAGGCLYLVSGGTSDAASYLLDASADGRDVFIATRQQLVPADGDENYDVYDYRVGGGFPATPPASPCGGEAACRPPASPPPAAGSPATGTFREAQTSTPPSRCARGKVRRKGRCVRRHVRHRRHAKHRRRGHRKHKPRKGRGRHGKPHHAAKKGRSHR